MNDGSWGMEQTSGVIIIGVVFLIIFLAWLHQHITDRRSYRRKRH